MAIGVGLGGTAVVDFASEDALLHSTRDVIRPSHYSLPDL